MSGLLAAAEGLFLAVFVVRAIAGRRVVRAEPAGTPRVGGRRAAASARALLAAHGAAIALVSAGLTRGFFLARGRLSAGVGALAGLGCLVAASAIAAWALRVFSSWRLLAQLDAGHALCTDGPYRFVRHPIYLAIDLWAAGSAMAFPGVLTLVGAALTIAGSDLRARAEERLLAAAFGERYRSYASEVRRLVPGVY